MNRWTIAAIAVSLIATTGCKKKVTLDDLDDELSKVTCQKLYECCSEAELEQAQGLFLEFEDEASCVEAYDSLLGLFVLPAIRGAVNAGRADYDPKAAGDCLREYEQTSCEEAASATGDFACDDIIIPLVDDGGVCKQDFECKGGSCYIADFESDEGVCQTLPGEGEDCLVREEDGFTLTDCAEDLECIDDKCIAPKEEGAACTTGQGCLSRNCVDDKCAALKAAGEDCFNGSECESGFCDTDGFTCGEGSSSGEGCGLL